MSFDINLLIIDDHSNFLETMIDLFEEKGVHCTGVTSGMAALRQIEKKSFDAILLDIKMPELNGVETFKKMKKYCKVPLVIMMTAHKVDHLIREALQEGAVGVLRKPFDINEVLNIIANKKNRLLES